VARRLAAKDWAWKLLLIVAAGEASKRSSSMRLSHIEPTKLDFSINVVVGRVGVVVVL